MLHIYKQQQTKQQQTQNKKCETLHRPCVSSSQITLNTKATLDIYLGTRNGRNQPITPRCRSDKHSIPSSSIRGNHRSFFVPYNTLPSLPKTQPQHHNEVVNRSHISTGYYLPWGNSVSISVVISRHNIDDNDVRALLAPYS